MIDDFDEERFDFDSDYVAECENKVKEIKEGLHLEMIVKIPHEMVNDNVDDEICNIISNKTGWLVDGFGFQRIKE